MGGATADITPTPAPPGCLKLALFLPIAPFSYFFICHTMRLREGKGRERSGGGCQVSDCGLSFLKHRATARTGTAARCDEREGDTGGRVA